MDLAVFLIPTCGASAFALLVFRWILRSEPPDADDGDGGAKLPVTPAGPNDLARSA